MVGEGLINGREVEQFHGRCTATEQAGLPGITEVRDTKSVRLSISVKDKDIWANTW